MDEYRTLGDGAGTGKLVFSEAYISTTCTTPI